MPATGDAVELDGAPSAATVTRERPAVPYDVVLWNDDINLAFVVVEALSKTFDYPTDQAHRLMSVAHEHGRATVWSGSRDRCVAYAHALHAYGLQATVAAGSGEGR